MFSKNPSGQPGRGHQTIESSMHGLATVLAAVAALLCSGVIFEYTYPYAFEYMADAFGDDALGQLGAVGFGALATATVFFIARIVLVLSLMLIASRVMVYAL